MIAIDTETYLVRPGLLAPRLVCVSFADSGGAGVLSRSDGIDLVRDILAGKRVIAGANIAYDFAVLAREDPTLLPAIFHAYRAGRVWDVQIAQALDAVAGGHLLLDPRSGGPLRSPETGKPGGYSLSTCVDLMLGRRDAKAHDTWRLRYAELDGVPLDRWPAEARQYPVDDARNTLDVALAQQGQLRNLHDLTAQCRAAWALHLGAVWGLRTDRERVEALAARVEAECAERRQRFASAGFYRRDGTTDTSAVKRAVARAYGATFPCDACAGSGHAGKRRCGRCDGSGTELTPDVPRTEKGGVSTARDTLLESGDEELSRFGDDGGVEKVRATYLPFLREGDKTPISLRPNVLVASGRTSYSGLIQLMGRRGGTRDCFRARPGYVYCSVDFSALELCTLAQCCLWITGESAMADVINRTGDPGMLHTALGARMAGITTEDLAVRIKAKDPRAKDYRQAAKPANFGFPGGMGAATLVLVSRKPDAGMSVTRGGREYPGVRFCVMIAGEEECGRRKVLEWRGRPCPPTCEHCLEIVQEQLRAAWFAQWPEMRAYFEYVNSVANSSGAFEQFVSKRVRGGCGFCDGANTLFQGLAADGAKHALWRVVEECYTSRESPLWGTRPIMFVHDEVFAEMPEERAHLAGPRMAEVMIAAMREYVPDVQIRAEPALMRWWDKSAEPAYHNGRLIPWEDRDGRQV